MSETVLVLGATGMLGNAVLRFVSDCTPHIVIGSARSAAAAGRLPGRLKNKVISPIDVENIDDLTRLLADVRPTVVVNCIGVVKQLDQAKDPLVSLPLNALFPHRLARLCALVGARLVHLSTDCVFSGAQGGYTEADIPDATDLYGRSKLLGEVDYPHAVTLRTSIIGHELGGSRSLVDWFLSQSDAVTGYRRAIFSGLPTVEMARIITQYVIPDASLHGVYHVSANPINKYDLLTLVAAEYGKDIEIRPDDSFVIDRSLVSDRFKTAGGYTPPDWPELVRAMHSFG